MKGNKEMVLGVVESRFADLVWDNAPISSGQLVELCEQELSWKKSTTYTVLKKLCQKGLFRNTDGVVSAIITRDEFHAKRSAEFVRDTYNGSLPAFVAAFTSQHPLSKEDADELQRIIDISRR